MIICTIETGTWIVWGVIGLIAGYMSGRLLSDRSIPTLAAVIVGIISSLAGGYMFIRIFGENDYGQTISLFGSLVVAALLLWILFSLFGKKES
ncbi:MAG: GlsB/YeaQ/YmgE family stress response membrane protein [Paramuribaculum sp.]|nr:GlsB/YeaQ/YmgE family stress response membrane protein [Paramuribaculum sp.]MDE6460221.1 GlsB/YeaQ/YmgE family stress response membrane protein [Paramuribaculum sp.]